MQKPSFFTKVRNDMVLMSSVFVGILGPVITIALLFEESVDTLPALIATPIGIAFAVLAYFRNNKLNQYFENGITVEAEVLKVSFYKRNGNVSLRYAHEAEEFEIKVPVNNNSKTRNLQQGSMIKLLLLPDNPKKPLIASLFE